jgi:mono/diheme cytochrome c family protein
MLARVDRVVAVASWVAAALVALMLLIGPRLVAEDESKPAGGATAGGKTVFLANCGSCHTLTAAGTSGQVGPSLDGVPLSAAEVEAIVQGGRGGIMPAFGGELSTEEISAVADFVAGAR